MPESNARVILEDKEGYMWIATQNGLVKYDGYTFKVYNLGNGNTRLLASTNVSNLITDKDGVIWAAVYDNGLFRYNRVKDTFEHFLFPANKHLTQFNIEVFDKEGNIWGRSVDTKGLNGAARFNINTRKFEFFGKGEKGNHYAGADFYHVIALSAGTVWFSSNNGLYTYQGAGKPLKNFMGMADTTRQRSVNPFYEAPSQPGVIWMNTFHGYNVDLRVTAFDTRNHTVKEYYPGKQPGDIMSAEVYAIYQDKKHLLWFASTKGLSSLNSATGKFTNYRLDPAEANGVDLRDFSETENGSFWFSTSNGPVYFDRATGIFKVYPFDPRNPGSAKYSQITTKIIDRTNTLWLGYQEAGFSHENKLKGLFDIYKANGPQKSGYPGEHGGSIYTVDNVNWLITQDGAYTFDNDFKKFNLVVTGKELNTNAYRLFPGANHMVYGIGNNFLIYNTLTHKKELYIANAADSNALPSAAVRMGYQDHTGRVWLGTRDKGVCSFDPVSKKITRYPFNTAFEGKTTGKGLDDSNVITIYEDSKHVIWVGTNDGGLNRFNPKTQTFTSFYNNDNRNAYCVDDIFEDSKGRLWIGTYLNGVYVFDRDKEVFTHHFSESNGLLFNSIMGIAQAKDGNVWVETERGLSKFNPNTLAFKNFNIESFLPGYNVERSLKGLVGFANGRFGMSLTTGLAVFDPLLLADNPYPPKVHIESVTYSDPSAGNDAAVKIAREGISTVELKYNQNRVQFNYVALQYDDPTKNSYAYKLDGYDKQWVPAGTQRSVTYTNLPAGTYTFHVKAANSDGIWNNVGDSIGMVIRSPWWLRWWAWLLYIVILVLIGYSYINYRQRHLKEENRILEEKITQRTQELSLANKALGEQSEEITAQRDQLADTVNELKTTQQQLVQSEKLASLGELTAGIAHEIQNPLNFVNNFSEVSIELAAEMREEFAAGNTEDGIALAQDIEQNLQKIMHHGKRADAIVKNMLQHSRNNSGDKQPANINALADEYLRLAYHGLRAKDKTFNATLVTEFAEGLPLVTIIPQDIGRVLLNMFNNAFYALQQRQKNADAGYKPTLSLSTLKQDNMVQVIVKDNGTGIPAHIKDKIMQPFFTTKPTGEGTGLGLSLSYDIIVKGHSGKIEILTKEEAGTAFVITIPFGL